MSATTAENTTMKTADSTDAAPAQPSGSVDGSNVAPGNQGHQPDTSLTPSRVRRRLAISDAAALAVGITASFGVQAIVSPALRSTVADQLLLVAATIPAFLMAAVYNKLYQARANHRRADEAMNIFRTTVFGLAWLLFVALAVQQRDLSRLWFGSMGICIAGALLIERRIARSIFTKLRARGQMARRIIVVGTDDHAVKLVDTYAANPELGYHVVGLVGDTATESNVEFLGRMGEIEQLLERHEAIGVVLSLNSVGADTVNILTRRLTDAGYHVALSSSLRDIDVTRLRPQSQDGQTMIYVEPTLRDGWRQIAKRVLDVSLALFILLITLPVQIATAIAIKATSPGPILFRQVRVGKNAEPFEVLKYRTMYLDAEERKAELMSQNEADGPLFKMKNDPRITPIGRTLRKLSIDELPQLFCVLLGTMSIVGPRPALPDEVAQWEDDVKERLRVLPGVTGLWQVSGRSNSSFETYKRMDLYYVDNWSLLHDVNICVKTVGVVLSGSGAS